MYGWLRRAGDESTHVVTANRRLARSLTHEFSAIQVAAGRHAWRSPTILFLDAWLTRLRSGDDSSGQATRINSNQSRLLWEQILRDHVRNPLVNINSLARDARDSWKALRDWNIPLQELVTSAQGADQHVFANAAAEYAALLEDRGWIDDASLMATVARAVQQGTIALPETVHLAGFDRVTPALASLVDTLRRQGTAVEIESSPTHLSMELTAFETEEAEMRAAGAWARKEISADPSLRVSIVVPNLERDSRRAGRLIREGFVPGWQYSGTTAYDAVNVSFGRRLSEYPAIETALTVLKWASHPLDGREVSVLLRSPFLGNTPAPGRARMELRLREFPDRRWTPGQFLNAAGRSEDTADRKDWLSRLSTVAELLREQPARAAPAYWAEVADTILSRMNWPGRDSLDSADFQLVDRWRDLLNELARLALVTPESSMSDAFAQLGAMATEAVFQPETTHSVIQVIGPLEAAGASFDRLWICGLTATQWPPPARPTAMISRRLQRQYGMPDADPNDTTEYSRRMLERLLGAADMCRCSFAKTVGDSDQSPTALLPDTSIQQQGDDPGWHTGMLITRAGTEPVGDDPVPRVTAGEKVRGGAGTLQLQLVEPFAAFAFGRLGVRRLDSISSGLRPLVRGTLIHAALFEIYRNRPTLAEILRWDPDAEQQRITDAVATAFARYEKRADKALLALLSLERHRVLELVGDVVDVDRGRAPFRIDALESAHVYRKGNLALELRIDRIDRLEDGSLAVLDYKTGTARRFLDADGDPRDIQVAVYAQALDGPVTMLGLFNVDSRETAMDVCWAQAVDDWDATLDRWNGYIDRAAGELAAGDIRLRSRSSAAERRPLGLLSRIGELGRAAS